MISENWTRENLAWMAGFFEGEGTFGWTKSRAEYKHPTNGKTYEKQPVLFFAISQNELDVLLTFKRLAGVGTINGPYLHESGTQYWRYRCSTLNAYALIVAMWPWLHTKRKREAAAAIDQWRLHRSKPRGRPKKAFSTT